MSNTIRINKYLADQKIASRREADSLITAGGVLVNGIPAKLGQLVSPKDIITIKTKPKSKTYLAYYKGRGIITHSPGTGETDIATKLAREYGIQNLAPVGRLDKESEGLIILTDDGRVTGPLLDPRSSHEKEYDVMVDKPITKRFITLMARGINIEGYQTKPTNIFAHKDNQCRFSITLTEGKKHQIRRMCAALGYQIHNLKRIRIDNITLGKLKPNQYRKITGTERKAFLNGLGL